MRDSSEQKVSTQDPKFMTITKFAWEEKAQQVKTLESKVEEMQKTLEFYGNADNWELPSFGQGHSTVVSDHGERARQALKGVKTK